MDEKPIDLAWLRPSEIMIEVELTQCREEGKDISAVEALSSELNTLDFSDTRNIERFEEFLDMTAALPVVDGFPCEEPSDLDGIRAKRSGNEQTHKYSLDEETLFDKVYGAWLGRISGCMLGKPVEGKNSSAIRKYLEATGDWPLTTYFSSNADEEARASCEISPDLSREGMNRAIEDDDTNYTTTGLAIIKKYGSDFSSNNVAEFWLSNIPVLRTFTAERIAYRNFLNFIAPPRSAHYQNVCREWIGAQIRADFYGYISPGQPARAAEFAWRDARISHVKNGIYGAMWVAAMLAAAYTTADIEGVIRAGLAQIPCTSRLHESIEDVIDEYNKGLGYEEAVEVLRARWDESRVHDWCHTISNAMIVAMSLLWGGGDFTRTLSCAVTPGFDTDCNAATAGSVLGLILGAKALPSQWTGPLNDTLETGVSGYHRVSISDMARETISLITR
ncbi:MAG TPA: ADP-ribosylglycohydrolase family protein [Armatimonadota bacterium]|jgi:ADP-ribosylglycohydrolase